MPVILCLICGDNFYGKPSHIAKGWAKVCSRDCLYILQKTGKVVACDQCGKDTYKDKATLRRSDSNKFFCNKSCQTIWRNKLYTKEKHANWTTGISSYRRILLREGRPLICIKCNNNDSRILAVHHRDKNRNNNDVNNLVWLCHNCHYLVHHYKAESRGFIDLNIETTP
jgi:hypothetical protein